MQQFAKNNLIKKFKADGFCLFNINNDKLIDNINKDIDELLVSNKFKTNSKIYSYNESPRIVESYKHSKNCKELATYPLIKEIIKECFDGDEPIPFSTINFLKSTQQPLHSDYAHFGTFPHLKLVGSWTALEDIHPDSGPLQVVPGSHKWKIYNFLDGDKKAPTSLEQIKLNYENYEDWVRKEIKKTNSKPITPVMKKGDCLLWDANMQHGSPECKNPSMSRKSQATHWSFTSVEKHYNPSFSNPDKEVYQLRELQYII
jgi:ectoine hydroxylase-related dioxygenase (phytanoyl-CoA dioxygenase family)